MKKIIYAGLITFLLATPAFAMDLQSARSNGVVVEQVTGYLKVAKPSAEADALVADVNSKRKAEYTRIAKEKGSSVDAVAAIAAQELLKK